MWTADLRFHDSFMKEAKTGREGLDQEKQATRADQNWPQVDSNSEREIEIDGTPSTTRETLGERDSSERVKKDNTR